MEPLPVETQRTCNASRFWSCIKSRLVASFGTVKVFLGFMVSRKAKKHKLPGCKIMQNTNVVKPKSETFKFWMVYTTHFCWTLGMVYGFRLATFQKAEIQHWWTAPCSDLCYSFNNLFDEGLLVAEGSHGPSGREEWQTRVVTLPASKFAAMPRWPWWCSISPTGCLMGQWQSFEKNPTIK